MKLAFIICLILCLWETEVAAKTKNSYKKKNRGRGGLWKKGLMKGFIYKNHAVYCNTKLRPEVHVQYVLAGCNITLAHPNRPRSQSWLRAVLEPKEHQQAKVQMREEKESSQGNVTASAEQRQTSPKPMKRAVLREAFMDCDTFGNDDDRFNMHDWYQQMCFGFSPLNDVMIQRRNATIVTPGVILMTNITVNDSGIYQARSGRMIHEFNLQVEKPHFKIKIVTKDQVIPGWIPKLKE